MLDLKLVKHIWAILFFPIFQRKRSKIPEKGQAFSKSQGYCPSKGETIWSQLVIFALEIMFNSIQISLFLNY